MTTYPALRREGIESLDEALYAASCFAASAADGSRTVTILCTVQGRDEFYRIEDGRAPARHDVDLTWEPVYVVEAPRRIPFPSTGKA